jgi:hypothetical protein
VGAASSTVHQPGRQPPKCFVPVRCHRQIGAVRLRLPVSVIRSRRTWKQCCRVSPRYRQPWLQLTWKGTPKSHSIWLSAGAGLPAADPLVGPMDPRSRGPCRTREETRPANPRVPDQQCVPVGIPAGGGLPKALLKRPCGSEHYSRILWMSRGNYNILLLYADREHLGGYRPPS